jgi:hypothetical protein
VTESLRPISLPARSEVANHNRKNLWRLQAKKRYWILNYE